MARKPNHERFISFRLSDQLSEQIERVAERQAETRSVVIRSLLRQGLAVEAQRLTGNEKAA